MMENPRSRTSRDLGHPKGTRIFMNCGQPVTPAPVAVGDAEQEQPEMTITGAIDAVRLCTTEVMGMRTCLNHSG